MNLRNPYRDPARFVIYHERKAIELANIINKPRHRQPTTGEIVSLLMHNSAAYRYRKEANTIQLKFKLEPRKMKLTNFLNKHRNKSI